MILIAHRGNTNGINIKRENSPSYIVEAILKGFHVEIDVWCVRNELFLGHDGPQYELELSFLLEHKDRLWIHCKNLDAMKYLKKLDSNELNYFGHDDDKYVLTSKNYLFCKPSPNLDENCVLVMPEYYGYEYGGEKCLGILTDFPMKYLVMNIIKESR